MVAAELGVAQESPEFRQDENPFEANVEEVPLESVTESERLVLQAFIPMQDAEIHDLNVMQDTDATNDAGAQVPIGQEEEGQIVIELSDNEAKEQHTVEAAEENELGSLFPSNAITEIECVLSGVETAVKFKFLLDHG